MANRALRRVGDVQNELVPVADDLEEGIFKRNPKLWGVVRV